MIAIENEMELNKVRALLGVGVEDNLVGGEKFKELQSRLVRRLPERGIATVVMPEIVGSNIYTSITYIFVEL